MEKITRIPSTEIGITKGYYIELECYMCGHNETIVGDTKSELMKNVTEAGWKRLSSDEYQATGHYDGCDYLDEK